MFVAHVLPASLPPKNASVQISLRSNFMPLNTAEYFDYEDIEKRDIIRVRIWLLDPKDKFVQVFFRDYYFEEYILKYILKSRFLYFNKNLNDVITWFESEF